MPTRRFEFAALQRRFTRSAATLLVSALVCSAALAQADGNMAAAWRATSRLGYAPTAASAQAAQADPKGWALKQIDAAFAASQRPANIPADLAPFNQSINQIAIAMRASKQARIATKKLTPEQQKEEKMAMAGAEDPSKYAGEMQQGVATWRLMSCSNPAMEQALLSKMTEFWFNHLNVYTRKDRVRPYLGNYVIEAIRPHVLGKFEDLLLASARHPAMLFYLDQVQSNARGINENYARELMELHTLGVNTVYTQKDVRELARILTGWTVDTPHDEGFRFVDKSHDQGEKILLGYKFPPGGVREGEEAIRMLARQPATAQRIARRLATTFVADKPPQALVDSLAATFTKTQGDIRAVMRTLVESPDFWRAENTLFKTPLDFACSALTAGGGIKEPREVQLTLNFLQQAGQPMHGWQTPDGYKTDAATWLAPEALTRRADYAIAISGKMDEPTYLAPFLSKASRERIAREAPAARTGLTLASPDFMSK